MRILILSPTFFDYPRLMGGAERYVNSLVEALVLEEEVKKIHFVSFTDQESYSSINGKIHTHIFKTKFINNNRSNPIINPRAFFINDWDYLYLHQFHTWLTPFAILWAKFKRKPLLLTDHNGGGPTYNRRFNLDRFIDLFLSTSKLSYKEIKLKTKSHDFIYGGVNEKQFVPPVTSSFRSGILFVGRAVPIKGIDLILKMLPTVSSYGKLTLCLAVAEKDKEYLSYLQQLALDYKNDNIQVEFKINLTQELLIQEYQNHLWTILPSIDQTPHESLGLTVFESLACDTPAAVSEFCGVSELSHEQVFFRVIKDWKTFFNENLNGNYEKGSRDWLLKNGRWSNVAKKVLSKMRDLKNA